MKNVKKSKKTVNEEIVVPIIVTAELEYESDCEEEIVAKRFEYNGKKYLKSTNDIIYDIESQDEIGSWDNEKKEIRYLLNEEE